MALDALGDTSLGQLRRGNWGVDKTENQPNKLGNCYLLQPNPNLRPTPSRSAPGSILASAAP